MHANESRRRGAGAFFLVGLGVLFVLVVIVVAAAVVVGAAFFGILFLFALPLLFLALVIAIPLFLLALLLAGVCWIAFRPAAR